MAYWDLFADVTLGPFTANNEEGTGAPTTLDNLSNHAVEVVGRVVMAGPAILDHATVGHVIDAPAQWVVEGAAEMTNGLPAGWNALSAEGVLPTMSGNSVLTRYTANIDEVNPHGELRDKGLLGCWKGAVGPSGTVVLAGEESREVLFVNYQDIYGLEVLGRFSVDGRPTAIASNALFPDLRGRPQSEQYLWVLVEQTESPTGKPKLQCRELSLEAPLLNEIELERDVRPYILWAANDLLEADFIVVTGRDGAIEIRDGTDPAMEIRASIHTGLYLPQVADVMRRPNLGTGACDDRSKAWHILVFSETGAKGQLLEYTEVEVDTKIVAPDINIRADVPLPAWYGNADLTVNTILNVEVPAVFEVTTITDIEHPEPTEVGLVADVTTRAFTVDNTQPWPANINAIEERVVADVEYEILGAADLGVS